jgi:hypothetical protein
MWRVDDDVEVVEAVPRPIGGLSQRVDGVMIIEGRN